MKKILALLLSLMLVLSLAACGGDDTTDTAVDEEPVVTDEAETPAEDEEVPEGRITDEQLADLTAAYNNVAVPYNEIATAVNENGWMNDEQTATEMKALSDTLGFIGKGLTEDISRGLGDVYKRQGSHRGHFPAGRQRLRRAHRLPGKRVSPRAGGAERACLRPLRGGLNQPNESGWLPGHCPMRAAPAAIRFLVKNRGYFL